ncbi:aminoacyl--tRNA ligase-related protein [Candidatus Mycoplasma haematominutum]|uniref:aminoacyl--tRNA ligase-related protein n=1 Tax=Candidatus Mycoplasma haematominutum TaxID=209446 RepID=UPI001FE0C9F5|nr:aminoacyl--tRNA ligase-related protein [Candidatus Mycoplasma haematominutum]
MSGTFFLHPRGCYIWESIQSFLNKEFQKLGVQNVLFPSLIPWSKFLEEQKLHNSLNLDEIIRLHSEKENVSSAQALRPTSEILFSHYFSERIREKSEKLPILLNQWSSVYREEKNTKLLFRSKEFYWQELHSIHEDHQEAREYLLKIHSIYEKLIKEILCIYPIIGEKTHLERFPGAQETLSHECILPDGQVLQMTTSHLLGSFFIQLMSIKNLSDKGIEKPLIQLSAGCSTRLIGAVVEMHKDELGLILPWDLSREQIAILFLNECSLEDIEEVSNYLKKKLDSYRLYWDKSTASFGKKINKAEKLGIPLIFVIGTEELKNKHIVIKSRLSKEKQKVLLEDIDLEVIKQKELYKKELLQRSKNFSDNLIEKSNNWDDLVNLIASGKVVIAPWKDSRENELNFREKKYNFSIRCIREKSKDSINVNCIFSKQPANCLAYFGRSY